MGANLCPRVGTCARTALSSGGTGKLSISARACTSCLPAAPLELDEVVVGAVGRHQRAGVPDVLALGTRLAAPVCADGASADGFLFLVSCC